MKYYSWFRPGLHDIEYARQAVEAGLAGFEAVYQASYISPEVHSAYAENVEQIKDELGVGFTVHAPILDIHLGSTNQHVRAAAFQEMEASIDFARQIGASLVVIHPAPGIMGMPAGTWSKKNYQRTARENEVLEQQEAYMVRAVKDLADSCPDLLLGLENLVFPHEQYRSPEELQELLRKVNRTNVGLTLDVGHGVVCGHQPSDFINLLGDAIFHVHLHDNNGVIDQHLPLGEGIIDYVAVIQSLKQLDYLGVVTLEFMLADPADYRDFVHQFA